MPDADQAVLPFTALWPLPNGPQLLVNGRPTGTQLAYYNPKNTIDESFGILRSDRIAGGLECAARSENLLPRTVQCAYIPVALKCKIFIARVESRLPLPIGEVATRECLLPIGRR